MPVTNELLLENPLNDILYDTVKEKPSDYNNDQQKLQDDKKIKLLKRIPLHRLMDLKIDYAFKQLFGNEKNKQITVVF